MKPQRSRIAVLDDDADLCKLLRFILKKEYDVLMARNGAELRRLVHHQMTDIVLLDIGLPDEDGISIARQIRTTSAIPVVFLSGFSSEDMVVKGLNIGADDYVTKPFQAEVLLARIRSALRRGQVPLRRSAPQQIRLGEWTFDVAQQNLVSEDGRSVKLTEMETRILTVLASADNQTLSRDEILFFEQRFYCPSNSAQF